MITIQDYFKKIYKILSSNNIERPHLETSWLLEAFCQINDVQRIQNPNLEVNALAIQKIDDATKRRLNGEPLAYILNEKEFYGFNFYVDSNVLIPRPETEMLVDWALQRIQELEQNDTRILDLGSGSGCVGLSILKKISGGHLIGVDISAPAIEISKRNAKQLNLIRQTNYFARDASKWLEHYALGEISKQPKFDIVVSNPPYIAHDDDRVESNVRKFEPAAALFSEEGGLQHVRKWLSLAVPLMAPKGAIAFEVGDGQGPAVHTLFRDQNVFSKHYIVKDYSGKDRIVCGEK